MAQQKGILQLEGTMGNITFYRTGEGYVARVKGGVSKTRIATDPAFARTRENGQEFGRAGSNGKTLRTAFAAVMPKGDARMTGRLVKLLVACIKADTVSARGERMIQSSALSTIEGFDFNRRSNLGSTLRAPYTATIDRSTGKLGVSLAAFAPESAVAAAKGTTHFKLITGGAVVDFAGSSSESGAAQTGFLDLSAATVTAQTLSVSLTVTGKQPIFLALGIQFYQLVNSVYYPLNNGRYDAMAIVKVDV